MMRGNATIIENPPCLWLLPQWIENYNGFWDQKHKPRDYLKNLSFSRLTLKPLNWRSIRLWTSNNQWKRFCSSLKDVKRDVCKELPQLCFITSSLELITWHNWAIRRTEMPSFHLWGEQLKKSVVDCAPPIHLFINHERLLISISGPSVTQVL
jgi:hypothetical protein